MTMDNIYSHRVEYVAVAETTATAVVELIEAIRSVAVVVVV